jgi:hypothetical protein
MSASKNSVCKKLDCFNICLHGCKYCINHKCPMEGCKKDNYYCEEHVCHAFYCLNMRVHGCLYCINHACPAGGCKRTYRCREHYCDNLLCYNLKLSGFNYCSRHLTFKVLVKIAKKERPYVPNDIWNLISTYE